VIKDDKVSQITYIVSEDLQTKATPAFYEKDYPMAKEDLSTSIDPNGPKVIKVINQSPPAKTPSGPKLIKQLERFAEASRDGKGNA
jgi:hypothetical protein